MRLPNAYLPDVKPGAMKTYIDLRKVKRRAWIANLISVGGLLILLGGVLVPIFLPNLLKLAQGFMIAGLGASMIGIFLANRWVRKPRPEDSLDQALKSLNDSHRLYHYPSLPCDHILLTPLSVIVLEVINLAGDFLYIDGRWKEKMNAGRALRYIVEEHLGNPTKNCHDMEQYLRNLFAQKLGNEPAMPVSSVVVFTHLAARLEVQNSPIPVCKIDKLRKNIPTKGSKLPPETYINLCTLLEKLTTNQKAEN